MKVIGYPKNDLYHDDYVGVKYLDKPSQEVLDRATPTNPVMYGGYGASRSVNLVKKP